MIKEIETMNTQVASAAGLFAATLLMVVALLTVGSPSQQAPAQLASVPAVQIGG